VNITRHVFWVVLASVGCATPMKSLREDNRRLNQSVAEMRAERRAQDRKIRDLEMQLAMTKKDGKRGSDPLPQLPIEVVAPPNLGEGQRLVAIADDGSEIVYEGDAALGKPAVTNMNAAVSDAPKPRAYGATTSRAARTSPATVRSDDAAAADYRAAVELVKAGKQADAVAALRTFLKSHPRHEYADNAQYWLGEAFYADKDYQHALMEFRATIETYPRGNKVPDALLKVGYCYQALGQADKARAVLEQVVNLYPKTEPALLAAKRLETP
jgi:tol-pal system protein YbgF